MKKLIPLFALLCACTPDESQIQAACANLNQAKANRPLREKMFTDCVDNSSNRLSAQECDNVAANVYPVKDWEFPPVASTRGSYENAYTQARSRGCGQ